ncbi:MAG: protein-L-isoaspartate(D-aspartate) O-methyltransferase [Flavobacteriales bacterium]|nr:protein-L-isoaspartate(D-aspartate) O-methyltransferase [Flavobacteriales bacterium]
MVKGCIIDTLLSVLAEKDTYRHQGMRKGMINTLQEMGIKDHRVLEAFYKVPRHLFLDTAFLEFAYENKAFPIGNEQTISHPYTVAFQTELLLVKPGDRILEIGTGSGFQTAILVELGAKVVTIERQKDLYRKAKIHLPKMGYRAMQLLGDGFAGSKMNGPYDSIIVTCGAPYIPKDLLGQLKPDGKMIIPVGEGEEQKMIEIINENDTYIQRELGVFSFVPMLPNVAKC